jgi:hypothetical protein
VCDRGAPPGPLLPGVRAHLWAPGWSGWVAEQRLGKNLGPPGREAQANLSSLSPQQNHQHEVPAAAGGDRGLW